MTGAVVLARRHDAAVGSGAKYICPMHREVVTSGPGDCPICGMALESARGIPGESARTMEMDSIPAASAYTERGSLLRHAAESAQRRVVREPSYAPAWLERSGVVNAVLYDDELSAVAPGDPAAFYPATAPTTRIDVHRTTDPPVPWDRSTSLLRLVLDGRDGGAPRAGTVGWVKLGHPPHESLVVPSAAVLHSEGGPYVLVFSADGGAFDMRPIEIGETSNGWTAVMSGLRAQEPVATMSTFLLDAERRLHARANASSGAVP